MGRVLSRIFLYFFLGAFAIIMLLPYLWMLLLSFKFQSEISMANTILPKVWTLRNYFRVFEVVPIVRWFLNSVVVTVSATVIILFTSTLVGFVFAKYQFPAKNLLFWFLLATMMVPPQTTLIPSFLLISKLGLYDRLPSLIVPGMVGGFGIFLCRQFIEDIPASLHEAAIIDGAKDFYIYFRIIIPLIRPAIGALTIFTFLQYWNDYVLPLIYLNRIESMTMSLAIAFFSTQRTTDIGAIMAAATLVMLPVTIVFLAFQKQFVKGIAITGLK